ncbi:MAG: DUF6011 domain-containing protein [Woeseiaceae bacterium]|nr:DUF6011 domain-containing protein [Woeseiaceae bacterium]
MTYAERKARRAANRSAHQAEARTEINERDAAIERLKPVADGGNNFAQSLIGQYERKGYLSDKQWHWVKKLADEAKAPKAAPAPATNTPNLAAIFDKFAGFACGGLYFSKKNGADLVWILKDGDMHYDRMLLGKLEGGKVTLFGRKVEGARMTTEEVWTIIADIERDPLAAAQAHGRLSGRCSCCSRELTDPVSVERGIGPVCLEKMS